MRVLSTRTALAAVAIALVAAAAPAAPAQAGDQVYIERWPPTPLGGKWGDRHTLTQNRTWNYSGVVEDTVCANAANANGWVGQTQCNSRWVDIWYCACEVRYPWAGPAFRPVPMVGHSIW